MINPSIIVGPTGPKKGVRKSSSLRSLTKNATEQEAAQRTPLLVELNASWREVDDPLQWMLQRKKGNPRKKNFGWRNRFFCRTREGLVRCVCECGVEIDADGRAKLQALPNYHPDREQPE